MTLVEDTWNAHAPSTRACKILVLRLNRARLSSKQLVLKIEKNTYSSTMFDLQGAKSPGYKSRDLFDITIFKSYFMRFRPFTFTRHTCVFSWIHVSKVFSSRFVFDKNATRISVDGKPKLITNYAFVYQNVLVRSDFRLLFWVVSATRHNGKAWFSLVTQ